MGWKVIRLEQKQSPQDSYRENLAEVVLLPKLRESLKKINPWMEEDQVDEVVKRITALPGTELLENNQQVLKLLLENISVSEDRTTGEKSPTVRYLDFENIDNNSFIAVSQFKIRIRGTEHHITPDIVLFLNGLPVVVVECKSPKVKEPISEAIDQVLRYSEQRGETKEGSPPLFLLQPVSGSHLLSAGVVRNDHHSYREVFLSLVRPISADTGRSGAWCHSPW